MARPMPEEAPVMKAVLGAAARWLAGGGGCDGIGAVIRKQLGRKLRIQKPKNSMD